MTAPLLGTLQLLARWGLIAAPEVRERLSSAGGEVAPGSPAVFADTLRHEQQRYEKLIRDVQIKPD